MGTSNVNSSTVHAYKKFKQEDLYIGYKFAPLVYRECGPNEDQYGSLKVDMTLVHDLNKQKKSEIKPTSSARNRRKIFQPTSEVVPMNSPDSTLSPLQTLSPVRM